MSSTLLIDAILRQTMVLIATLATAGGQRAPLAHLADRVFSDLVRELGEQGVRKKVIADMFGMALRTYQARVARMSASQTDPELSLWGGVHQFIRDEGPVRRATILERFHQDDNATVRSVLRDLVDSGLIYRMGRGDSALYRAPAPGEVPDDTEGATLESLALVAIHQNGPVTLTELGALIPTDTESLTAACGQLLGQGLVTREATERGDVYRCERCVIPLGATAGWEAAVFDHYQAMVAALVTKLRIGQRRADLSDALGGSTFSFDVWPSHPLADEVLGLLRSVREQGLSLRERVDAHNAGHEKPSQESWVRVTTYVGQAVKEDKEDDDERSL
jgi:hypothetical protein